MGNYVRGGYHGQRKPWRGVMHRPEGQMAGIELEIEHRNGYQHILDALPDTQTKLRPCTERDASIDHYRGVEIIFPPYKYSTIRNGQSFISKALRSLEDSGAVGSVECGMHVNINTTGWHINARRIFACATMCLPENVLTAIGGRELRLYCRKIHTFGYSLTGFWERMRSNHHSAVNVMRNRIELRFPAATTDVAQLRQVLTFAEYMEMYANSRIGEVRAGSMVADMLDDTGEQFLTFLKQQKKTKSLRSLIKVIENAC